MREERPVYRGLKREERNASIRRSQRQSTNSVTPSTSQGNKNTKQSSIPRRALRKGPSKKMTYDDYMNAVNDSEALFELDENPNALERMGDYSARFKAWSRLQVIKQSPVVKQKLKIVSKLGGQKMQVLSRQLVRVSKLGTLHVRKKTEPVAAGLVGRLGRRNAMLLSGASVLALLIFSVTIIRFMGRTSSDQVLPDGQVAAATDVNNVQEVPTFPIIESDTVREDQGVVFDSEKGVATFQDTVGGYTVTISQQPLTDDQIASKDTFLSEVSVNLFAQGSFKSNKGTVYYTVPLPDIDPSQSIMFIHKDLLIFVRTQGISIDAAIWETYVNSLN